MAARTVFRSMAAAIVLCTLSAPVATSERLQTASVPVGAHAAPAPRAPSVLEQARNASPQLGEIVEEFAARDLGEAQGFEGLDDRTREIATAAAFAAVGDMQAARRHAEQALRYGATNGALREVLYLTAVHAGAPKAIEAARAFAELLAD